MRTAFLLFFTLSAFASAGQCTYNIIVTDESSPGAADAQAHIWPGHDYSFPINYVWSNGDTTLVATGLTAGSHHCVVTDGSGCSQVVTFTVQVGPKSTAFWLLGGDDIMNLRWLLNHPQLWTDSTYCQNRVPDFRMYVYGIGFTEQDSMEFRVDYGDGDHETRMRTGTPSTLDSNRMQWNVIFFGHTYPNTGIYDVSYTASFANVSDQLVRNGEVVIADRPCGPCLGDIYINNITLPSHPDSSDGSFTWYVNLGSGYHHMVAPWWDGVYMIGIASNNQWDTLLAPRAPLFQPSNLSSDTMFISYFDFWTGCYVDTSFWFGSPSIPVCELPMAEFTAYPNPAKSVLHVNSEALLDELILYDLRGTAVLIGPLGPNQNPPYTLDVHGLAAGCYLLHGRSGSDVRVQRVVVTD